VPSTDTPSLALTLNAELMARLPERVGFEIVSAPYASSLQDFSRLLATISERGEGVPAWILDVSVVLTDRAAHVVAVIYRGTGYGVVGRDSFDQNFDDVAELAIDVPQAIAARVAGLVERTVDP
jgi:hypothetical protein